MAGKTPRNAERRALVAELDAAGRAMSTVAVMFHSKLAELQGLSVTEEKSLDLIARFGPLTAGELARRSGLSKASVTGLVDRLVQKGFARRSSDPDDGRRVRIEFAQESLARLAPLFADFVRELHTAYADFDDGELRTVLRFMTEITRRQAAATQRLSLDEPSLSD
ncbi:MAG: transcriptional regulator [Myxococcaceae bacterium]|nr:transcriptional regulator [Myxococcaceae bacterium]